MTSAKERRRTVTPREPSATSSGRENSDDLTRQPPSAARDEVLALVDQELAARRDPRYQAARLEAERCLAGGRQVPGWAMRELNKG
jgi:hypothetical protein